MGEQRNFQLQMRPTNQMLPKIFLANVGVNSNHGLKSPRFADGRFEFVTIPELGGFQGAEGLVRYSELKCWNEPEQPLTRYLPPSQWNNITHFDPEFIGWTYGDECGRNPRAASLKQIQVGDLLVFLARLTDYHEGQFIEQAGFYLIGYLEIAEILSEVRSQPEAAIFERLGHNAHLRRARNQPGWYDGFYIFRGSPHSRRFEVAQPFRREEAEKYLRDRNGKPWKWKEGHSDLQTIGSYTRTCRCILNAGRGAEEAERTMSFMENMLLINNPISGNP